MTKTFYVKTTFLYILITLLTLSCDNDKRTEQPQDLNTITQTPPIVETTLPSREPVIDSGVVGVPTRDVNRKMHFPEGMFKTYPQIVNNIFAVGTSKEELINILGRPELVEKSTRNVPNTGIKDDVESWYYGEMIIELTNDVVSDVSNYEGNKHCFYNYGIQINDLYISDIAIEKRWALHLLDNRAKADRSIN